MTDLAATAAAAAAGAEAAAATVAGMQRESKNTSPSFCPASLNTDRLKYIFTETLQIESFYS